MNIENLRYSIALFLYRLVPSQRIWSTKTKKDKIALGKDKKLTERGQEFLGGMKSGQNDRI